MTAESVNGNSRKFVTLRHSTPWNSVVSQIQLRFGAIFEISTGHRKSGILPNQNTFYQNTFYQNTLEKKHIHLG